MGDFREKYHKVALFAAHAQERVALLARGESQGTSLSRQWSEDIQTH